MAYFTQETLKFLSELRENNDRDWFHENKKTYEKYVKEPFNKFVEELIFVIQDFEPNLATTAKNAIFRIYRDVRFSKDKSPYKTHVSASINSGSRTQKNLPGYYIQISGDQIFLGGGIHFVDKFGTLALREHIRDELGEFNSLINDKEFKDKFGELTGDKNKRIPKEFQEAFEKQELIANKNFFYGTNLPASLATSDDFMFIIEDHFRCGSKLNDFFKEAVSYIK